MKRPFLFVVLCLLIIIGIFYLISKPSYTQQSLIYGVGVHPSHYDTLPDTTGLKTLSSLGVSMVREDITWSSTEINKGFYDFSGTDRKISELLSYNITTLPILTYGNYLYANIPSGQGWAGDRYMPPLGSQAWEDYKTAFGQFIYHSVLHLSQKYNLIYYEIWNEPYGFYAPTTDNNTIRAIHYAELMKVAYAQAKLANPKAQILIGGLGTDKSLTDSYTSVLYQYGIKDSFDIMNIHPYEYASTNLNYAQNNKNIDYLYNLMALYGDTNKTWWITEIGRPSEGCSYVTNRDLNGIVKNVSVNGCSNSLGIENQSLAMTNFFTIVKKYPYIKAVFWYDFKEDGLVRTKSLTGCLGNIVNNSCPVETEARFGITNYTFSPKPAFYTYQNIIKNNIT